MGKPFFYRITAAEFLAAIIQQPEEERGAFCLSLALDMVAADAEKASSEFARQIITEAIGFSEKKRDAANKRWNAVHKHSNAQHKHSNASSSSSSSSSNRKDHKQNIDFSIPDFIPVDLWDAFEENRKQTKPRLTDRARTIAVSKLKKFSDDGYEIRQIMEATVVNGWKSFYLPNGEKKPAKVVTGRFRSDDL